MRLFTRFVLVMVMLFAVYSVGAVIAQSQVRLYLPLLVGRPALTPAPRSPTPVRTPDPAVPSPTPTRQNELRTGQATYYDATGDGNCMFGPSPNDLMVAAISHEDYGKLDPAQGPAAVYCGAYVEVTGELGSVVVRIVDKCPDPICTSGHLDMSPQAFARIAPIEKGIVPITWRVISPDLGRPVAYHIKPGSNQWWTAIQVRYHRNPIVKLEYRNGAGQWVPMVRQDYNYFVGEGMGPGPYTLRVTDTYGNVLTDSGIPLIEGSETPGAAQFRPGP